jgi:hypothetical protein
MRQEIRNWTTTNFKGDFIPVFVEIKNGAPNIVVNASDMIGMTRSEAEAVAYNRNRDQVDSARKAVEQAQAALDAAKAHLVRVEATFEAVE